MVNKAVKKLKTKNYVDEGYLKPPKGESKDNWKKIKIDGKIIRYLLVKYKKLDTKNEYFKKEK